MVEPQILHRSPDLTILDEERSIPSHTCQSLGSRLDFSNIPEPRQQQSLIQFANKFVGRLGSPFPLNDEIRWSLAQWIGKRQLMPCRISTVVPMSRYPT